MSRVKSIGETAWLTIFLVIVLGAIGSVILVQQGVITSEQIAKYGLWALLGLIVLFLFATTGTRTKWDDIILSYLLLLAIGGFAGTWLIDNGYVSQGYLLLGGLGLLFIILLGLYSKHGYKKVRGARFE